MSFPSPFGRILRRILAGVVPVALNHDNKQASALQDVTRLQLDWQKFRLLFPQLLSRAFWTEKQPSKARS